MKKNSVFKKLLTAFYHYFIFFLLVAFLVSCTTMLFVTLLTRSLGVTLTSDNLQVAAKWTFLNVLLLSVLFTAIDAIRRRMTTARITRRIKEAAKEIVKGDFSVRIPRVSSLSVDENYNVIIDCFNAMAKELSSVETLRTDFVTNVSHEMKTPLAVIRNYGRLLEKEDLPAQEREEYARGVSLAAGRLSDMMTSVLRLSRLENQRIYPRVPASDLGEHLATCVLAFEEVWEQKNITLQTDIAEAVRVTADGELLSLVFHNLLSNAFKFTEAGGTVSVSLSTEGDRALVRVSDTGCGISPDVGAHIFEKFYQGDTSHATEGNGLGLALVRRVVDIVQGEIAVASTEGEGSTFTLKIARVTDDLEEIR